MVKKQRNIRQTHQEREIIKTAPDLVIYLEGLPYLINPYLGDGGTLINFNDYVTVANGSCDVDSYIPSASFTLSIPNAHKRLFLAPGGNRIISTMMDVRIFAKGYYMTPAGDTVYHRVFWGVTSSITYNDTGSTLEIDISCKGIMRLMELMQTNAGPSISQFGSPEMTTAFKTKFHSQNAFLSAFYMFVEPIQMSVLRKTSIKELKAGFGGSDTDEKESFDLGYAPKWGIYLRRLLKGLRFYPFRDEHKNDVFTKWAVQPKNSEGLKPDGYAESVHVDITDKAFLEKTFAEFKELVNWAPDYSIGNIGLFNSEVITRLERLRQMVDLIGYEGFQDLDGRLIIKPPLYNLDVTQWAPPGEKTEAPSNPFIVHLSEIEQESEQEDEGQIRFTRTSVRGTMGRNPLMQGQGDNLLAVSSWVDLNLMRKFGLRCEEPKSYSFLGEDTQTNFAWAVNEMTKSNRGYRSYQCTIPLRPELKLGYPIYLPHMDMFGYLRNMSWGYSVGGTATMRLHLDCIRERVLNAVKESKEIPDPADSTKKKTVEVTVYRSIPNLVFKWTDAKKGKEDPKPDETTAKKEGNSPASVHIKPEDAPNKEQKADTAQKLDGYKKLMEPEPTTPDKAWRIQPGGVTAAEKSATNTGGKTHVDFREKIPIDSNYYYTLRTTIPYTDNKGYVVLAPFPWGRHMALRQALELFSMSSTERDAQEAARAKKKESKDAKGVDFNEGKAQEKLNAFLFTALGTPSFDKQAGDAWNAVYSGLVGIKNSVLGEDGLGEKAEDDRTWFVMQFDAQGKDLTLKSMATPASAEAAKTEAGGNVTGGSASPNSSNLTSALVTGPQNVGKP